jgi:hypothetical protein
MNYDFQMKNRGYLKIEGPLADPDSVELETVILKSLDKCHDLELNIDDITSLSTPCVEVLGQVGNAAKQKQKALFLATRYQMDAMTRWFDNISGLKRADNRLDKRE